MTLLDKANKAMEKNPKCEAVYARLFGKDWRKLLAATTDDGKVSGTDLFKCADKSAAIYRTLGLKSKEEEFVCRKFGEILIPTKKGKGV